MKRVLLVRQHDETDCAAACIASVCGYYKLYIPVARIRQYANTDRAGTSVLGIIEAAEKSGMQAKGVRASFASLQEIELPAIAHVVTEEKRSHYVVISRILKKVFVIMDPAQGRLVKLNHGEFLKIWSGVLVIMKPGETFRPLRSASVAERLWQIALPERKTLLFTVTGAFGISILGLLPSVYIAQIVDRILPEGNTGLLNILSVLMIVALIVQVLIEMMKNILSVRAGQHIMTRLTIGYYRHLLCLPQRFFDTMRTGEIISRVNDSAKISSFISEVMIGMVVNVLILLFSVMLMFIYYWKLALIILIIVPVYVVLFYINDLLNKKWQRKLMIARAEMESQLFESIGAAGTVKRSMLGKYCLSETENRFGTMMKRQYKSLVFDIRIQGSAEFSTRLFTIILLWAGSYFVMGSRLSAGELLSFYALIAYFTSPVMHIIGSNRNIREAIIAAERLFGITDLETEKNGKMQLENNRVESIQFINASFRYGNSEHVIKNLDLEIKKGTITGITGESGSGKSTLASLLQNIYPLSDGKILINDIDMRYIGNESLRSAIITVPQKADLFSASILENICPGEFVPDIKAVLELCDRLGISDFTDRMPERLDTLVAGQGNNLSGGQKQKIAIARALYRQPSVLILDEATASLDAEAEKKVMQTFEWYRQQGNTIVIIAHRPSALDICDHIIILENGRISK